MDPSAVRVETEAEKLAKMEIEADSLLSHSSSLPMDPSAVRGETEAVGGETEAERLARWEIETDRYLARVNRPYVKSFTNRDGEIIDCVRIEDQLGFDPVRDAHILKQIRMSELEKPETDPFDIVVEDDEPSEEGSPNFNRTGKRIPRLPDEDCCSEGTVPIRRITKESVLRLDPKSFGPKYPYALLRDDESQPIKPVKPSKSES